MLKIQVWEAFILAPKYELKKVKALTSLIYFNIVALHNYPYSLLLFSLGKKNVK